MRQAIIAGNWKMFKSSREAKQFAEEFKPLMEKVNHCEIVICPPFTCLETLARELAGSNIALGAQNMHWEEQGAYTGEISPLMLRELGCKYAIIGHSERREYFGETDEIINRKLKTAQRVGLIPILCVGEKLEHRETGVTNKVIEAQLNGAL
ncbi:MAG TPA: triose-phosphate isomerase, partial [Verrucomicrobiae bacterium]|nr:triose-phosphate isomerase [Verrucomicrobiae bacterium]